VKRVLAVIALLAMAAVAAVAPTLPEFAGWRKVQTQALAPLQAGLAGNQAAALGEYGLVSVERDVFQRGDRQIHIEGLRFHDSRGAFGAFTFLRPANFHSFDIGQKDEQAASGGTSILFTRGEWLMRVEMDELTAMTAAEMRDLAARIPVRGDPALSLPNLPYYLPLDHRQPGTLHFTEGPAAFAASCDWLPATAVGFDHGAETALAAYDLPMSPPGAELLVISYPTPTMARTRLAGLEKAAQAPGRRSGPLVILVHGLSADAAAPLLQAVNYDAEITKVPPVPVGVEGLPALILGIFLLCALIIGVAVVVGVLSGTTAVMLERVLPERFRRRQQENLIRLHLEGKGSQNPQAGFQGQSK
jgi:hypothetical protein